jgi:GMP synthase-like glutamine amidotransferase
VKIGILKTDAVREEWVADYGEYPDMFVELLGSRDPSLEFTTYDVRHGEYPADIDDEDAYLITGSRHSVYDELPWIPPLLDFVRELDRRQKKLVGICFGHQLVAEALGGRVRKAQQGWGVGLHRHRFSERPAWFDEGELEVPILVTHQDQVIDVPAQAAVLASSDFCPNAALQIGDHILTLQGHPEFVSGYSRAIIEFRRELIGEDVYHKGLESLQDAPATDRMAHWIIDFLHQGQRPDQNRDSQPESQQAAAQH